jgi:hypothetical protein
MSDEDIAKVGYWIDKVVKVAIGVFIAIAGFEYKALKSDLDDLKERKHVLLAEIQILRSFNETTLKRLERLENKIDLIIQKVVR